MSGFEHYINSYDQVISTLSVNVDYLVDQAYRETWELDRSQRVALDIPFLQSSMNDFSYDLFYFVARVIDLIKEVVLYVKPEKVILAISGCIPTYKIELLRRKFYSQTGSNVIFSQLTCPGTVLTEILDKAIKEWIPKAQDGTATSARTNKSGKMITEQKTVLPQDVYYYHYTMPGEATTKIIQALSSPEMKALMGTHIIYSPNPEGRFDLRVLSLCLFNSLPRVLLAEKDYTQLFVIEPFAQGLPITAKDYAVLLTVFCDIFLPKLTQKSIFELVDLAQGFTFWSDDKLSIENLQKFISKLDLVDTNYDKVFLPRGNVQDFITKTGISPVTQWSRDDISQMCSDYYRMARWACSYLSLQSMNWDISYSYLYPPSISDLVSYSLEDTTVEGEGCQHHIYHQLLCELDLRSKQFAPTVFSKLLEQKSELSYLYPLKYQLSEEGTPILPRVQMSLVKDAMSPYLVPNTWDLYNIVTRYQFAPSNPRSISYAYSRLGNIAQSPQS